MGNESAIYSDGAVPGWLVAAADAEVARRYADLSRCAEVLAAQRDLYLQALAAVEEALTSEGGYRPLDGWWGTLLAEPSSIPSPRGPMPPGTPGVHAPSRPRRPGGGFSIIGSRGGGRHMNDGPEGNAWAWTWAELEAYAREGRIDNGPLVARLRELGWRPSVRHERLYGGHGGQALARGGRTLAFASRFVGGDEIGTTITVGSAARCRPDEAYVRKAGARLALQRLLAACEALPLAPGPLAACEALP